MVACAARLDRRAARCGSGCRWTAGTSPSSTARGSRSPTGEIGELIIGGVGLARYLDPAKDAEKYAADADAWAGSAPTAAATWSGYDGEGLVFVGRADDQVKLGGRRIELGEVDSALLGAARRAPARRPPCARTAAGNQLLVGYVAAEPTASTPTARARRSCASALPAALVPRLAVVDDAADPHLGQGRPGRAAVAAARRRRATGAAPRPLDGTAAWLAELWPRSSARVVTGPTTTSSTSAAAASPRPSWCRGCATRFPEVTVADIYEHPDARRAWRRRLDDAGRARRSADRRRSRPTPRKTQLGQVVAHGRRCAPLVGPALADLGRPPAATSLGRCARRRPGCPTVSLVVGAGSAGCCWSARPAGWLLGAAAAPGCCCAASSPGDYPRGGAVHLRLWLAERLADELGADQPRRRRLDDASTPALLGAKVGRDVDLHSRAAGHRPAHARARAARSSPRSTSPATGSTATCCTSAGSASAPDARVGARSTLLPGRRRRRRAPRSRRLRRASARCPPGERWSGVARAARRHGPRPVADDRPPRPAGVGRGVRRLGRGAARLLPARRRRWPGSPSLRRRCARRPRSRDAVRRGAAGCRSRRVVGLAVLALLVAGRACGCSASACDAGHHPVHSRPAGRPGRPSGCWTRPAPGCSRSTPSLLTPVVAAGARAPRSAGTSRRRRCC